MENFRHNICATISDVGHLHLGMYWLYGTHQSPMQAKEYANKVGYDDYYYSPALADNLSVSSFSKADYKRGKLQCYSAALAFAEAIDDHTFVSVSQVISQGEEYYWVLAVNNGHVEPDGDLVFSGNHLVPALNTAKALYESIKSKIIYIDEDINHNLNDLNVSYDGPVLESLSPTKDCYVSPVLTSKEQTQAIIKKYKVVPLLVLTLLGGASAYSYSYYQDIIAQEKLSETREKLRKELADKRLRDEIKKKQNELDKMPWRNAPELNQVVSRCLSEGYNKLKFVPGWEFTKLTCTQEAARVVYLGADYPEFSLIRKAFNSKNYNLSIPENGQQVNVSWSFTPYPEYKRPDKELPLDTNDVRTYMNDIFSTTGGSVSLKTPQKLPGSYSEILENQSNIKMFNFTIRTEVQPDVWVRSVSKIPTIMIDSLVADMNTGSWEISGVVFHRR